MKTETGLTFEVEYHRESKDQEPSIFLKKSNTDIEMDEMARYRDGFIIAIDDLEDCETKLELEKSYTLLINQHEDGTHDNRNIFYMVVDIAEKGVSL